MKEHPLIGVPVFYVHYCNMENVNSSLLQSESLLLPQWISLTLADLGIFIECQ